MINAGSSSIKASLYKDTQLVLETQLNNEQPALLVEDLLSWIDQNLNTEQINAIGHRIVHGGGIFSKPTFLDHTARAALNNLVSLDPDHLPTALHIIDTLTERMPSVAHVACFDTAFFHNLPRVAQIVALPREYEAMGLRKYGFHGLSYESILEILKKDHSVDVASSRIICAHLGSGASLAAIANGVPVDTTMSMTPASGIPMSTRSGSIDPGIVNYLHDTKNVSAEEFHQITTKKSGLLGISETTPDMYALLQQEDTDIRSKEAIDVFCYEVKKSIGALSATLGGIDVLVFAGGIGEKAPKIRQRILSGLDYLGLEIDDTSNQENKNIVSKAHSAATIYALQSDEASVMVKQVNNLLQTKKI